MEKKIFMHLGIPQHQSTDLSPIELCRNKEVNIFPHSLLEKKSIVATIMIIIMLIVIIIIIIIIIIIMIIIIIITMVTKMISS